MSGSTRAITLSLRIGDAERLQADLRAMGTAGEDALNRLEAAAQRAGSRSGGVAAVSSTFGELTPKIQSAGYQLQDFFIQVQSGTDKLTAFSQQGSQFLGVFGPAGAVAGAALAIGAVGAQFLFAGDSAADAAKRITAEFKGVADGQKSLAKAIEDVNALYRTQAQQATAAAAASRSALGSSLSMSLDQLVQRNEGNATDLVQAQRDLAAQEAAIKRRQDETYARTGSRVSDADRDNNSRLFEARARVAGLQQDMDRVSGRIGEVNTARERLAAAPIERPEDPKPERAARAARTPRTPAERIPGDPEGVLERLRGKIVEDADRVAGAADPATKALNTYTDAIEKLARAGDLYQQTSDREGGPLGYSPERVTAVANALKSKYLDALDKTGESASKATGSFDQFFSKAASGFESAIAGGKSFSDIMQALEKDLATLIIRLTILNPLAEALKSSFSGAGGVKGIFEGLFTASGGAKVDADIKPDAGGSAFIDVGGAKGFANGGIMTSFGELPLRKYAAGGIARSPQVAVFGERQVNAEAYVPLPDGRTIPVTMQGGGGGVINIDARGADAGVEQRIDMVLARRMPGILAASRADLTSRVNRGGADARTFGRR